MQLAKWIHKNGKAAAVLKLAAATACERSSIYRYVKGRIPDNAVMSAFYRATEGKVEPNDFYDLPRLAPKERRARESERLIILSRRHLPPDLHRQVMAALDVSDAGQAAA